MSDCSYYPLPVGTTYCQEPQSGFESCWSAYDNTHGAIPVPEAHYQQPSSYTLQSSAYHESDDSIPSPSGSPTASAMRAVNVPKKKGRAMQVRHLPKQEAQLQRLIARRPAITVDFESKGVTRASPVGIAKRTTWTAAIVRSFQRSDLLPRIVSRMHTELMLYRFENIVETMIHWMTSQSNSLTALSRKIDAFDSMLSDRERRDRLQGAASTPQSASSSGVELPLQREPQSWAQELRPSSVLHWHEMRKVFSRAGVDFNKAYLRKAEDRPVLQLQTNHNSSWESCDNPNDGPELHQGRFGRDNSRPTPLTSGKRKRSSMDGDCTSQTGPSSDFNEFKVRKLHHEFVHRVLCLHPFLSSLQLQQTVNDFVKTYIQPNPVSGIPPAKRRCLGLPDTRVVTTKRFDQRSTNAIVLLALAIGEAAAYRVDPLGIKATDDTIPVDSEDSDSREAGGISYFREAMRIVSAHMDGNELVHAQMFLMAGIYKAHLARMNEASSWYSMAGRVLIHLINRRRLFRTSNNVHKEEDSAQSFGNENEMILRTAWSCLRLESDITPDLKLPSSGLEGIAHKLQLPHLDSSINGNSSRSHVDGRRPPAFQNVVYRAQLQLTQLQQKTRHSWHSSEPDHEQMDSVITALKRHQNELRCWWSTLPEEFREEPSNDMQTAQLQHSYFETQISLLRPFLDYTLHNLPRFKHAIDFDLCLKEPGNPQRSSPDLKFLSAINNLYRQGGVQEILQNAELCLQAAKQSLAAFDGIQGPLVVPDILSLLHGQFCNVLLLTAARDCEQWRGPMQLEELRQLVGKTVTALKGTSTLSPACKADHEILEAVYKSLDKDH
ncbi:Hypothetical predicted protein [Lecanosticta acicola]|uniref:Transcription factor domain-containing protein n=1 Tax=Lecanosticta acicola TaxID=111012 RepID=A0AAI8YST1_9PEZI|nr:Hypothetical predicted protein [Lecanosticta acicola]